MNDLQFSIAVNQVFVLIVINKFQTSNESKYNQYVFQLLQYIEKLLDCVESTTEKVQTISIACEALNNDSKYEYLNTFKALRIEAQSITDPREGKSRGKLTERLEPKITNFKHCRKTCQETTRIKNPVEMYPWMAPEKIFGMLLWELAFQNIPYQRIHNQSIKDYVTNGSRETLDYDFGTSDILNGFIKIIKKAWDENPINRPNFQCILEDLENLREKYIKEGFIPNNDDSTSPEMISSKDYGNQLRSDDFKNPAIHHIIP
ncbi:3756_t:CDS:2 [Funneliformis caledonium]|uniref:3756_t:CDS:1 n=1 Tax=Funneliformis caledonium TaxID=1117310 RepID=A0A9N9GYJ2_9GLOM|nr:3756_t:CDS:2 [Funneliformis caledonium]